MAHATKIHNKNTMNLINASKTSKNTIGGRSVWAVDLDKEWESTSVSNFACHGKTQKLYEINQWRQNFKNKWRELRLTNWQTKKAKRWMSGSNFACHRNTPQQNESWSMQANMNKQKEVVCSVVAIHHPVHGHVSKPPRAIALRRF